jgi:hypothetical protein
MEQMHLTVVQPLAIALAHRLHHHGTTAAFVSSGRELRFDRGDGLICGARPNSSVSTFGFLRRAADFG